MMVNGEPRLTCAHVPHRLRARARCGSSRSRNFPVIRDLVVDIDDFMHKLPTGQAVDHPRGGEAGRPRASTCRRRQQLDEYKQFSMCINCMLCYAACPVYGLDPRLPRPGGDRAGAALQPRLPRQGSEANASDRACRIRKGSGDARSSVNAPEVCPKHVDPPGPFNSTN